MLRSEPQARGGGLARACKQRAAALPPGIARGSHRTSRPAAPPTASAAAGAPSRLPAGSLGRRGQRCSASVEQVAAKAAGEGKLRLRAGLRPASRAARGAAPVCSACKLSRCGSVASCPPGCPECGMCGDVPAAGGCCSGARCGGRVRGCACVAAECAVVRMRPRMRA